MKKKLSINIKIIIGLVVFFIITGSVGASLAWYDLSLNTRPKSSGLVGFEIIEGQKTIDISTSLKEKGLINNTQIFLIYVKINNLLLKAGNYELSKSMSIKEIADIFSEGKVKTYRVTIKEGWTIQDTGEYLEKEKIFTKIEFEKALNNNYSYLFLSGRTGRENMEGFLFPDTYDLSARATANDLINKMLKNMENHLKPEIVEGFKSQGLTLKEGVILASIVEVEGQKSEDRALIAGILLKRNKIGMKLEADATVRYIIKNWNKKLTLEDLAIDSPYNTRLKNGFPPGAISNPGGDSLKAVALPKDSNYLFYLSEKNGTMHYAATLEEHNANAAKYLNY